MQASNEDSQKYMKRKIAGKTTSVWFHDFLVGPFRGVVFAWLLQQKVKRNTNNHAGQFVEITSNVSIDDRRSIYL